MTTLLTVRAYVTAQEKRQIDKAGGGSVSNYLRLKLGLPAWKRGRKAGKRGAQRADKG